MANLVSLPIYRVNSSVTFENPSFRAFAFPAAGVFAEPVGTPTNIINGAYIYSKIKSAATGGVEFYSSKTVAEVVTACNS